jgi:hypothetical protein
LIFGGKKAPSGARNCVDCLIKGLQSDFGRDVLIFAIALTDFELVNLALRADYTSFRL